MLIAAEIADINRFENPKSLVSYAGLCPGIHQSGPKSYAVMRKEYSHWLKWAVVESSGRAAIMQTRYARHYCTILDKARCEDGPVPELGCYCENQFYTPGYCLSGEWFENMPEEFPWYYLIISCVVILVGGAACSHTKSGEKEKKEVMWDGLKQIYKVYKFVLLKRMYGVQKMSLF